VYKSHLCPSRWRRQRPKANTVQPGDVQQGASAVVGDSNDAELVCFACSFRSFTVIDAIDADISLQKKRLIKAACVYVLFAKGILLLTLPGGEPCRHPVAGAAHPGQDQLGRLRAPGGAPAGRHIAAPPPVHVQPFEAGLAAPPPVAARAARSGWQEPRGVGGSRDGGGGRKARASRVLAAAWAELANARALSDRRKACSHACSRRRAQSSPVRALAAAVAEHARARGGGRRARPRSCPVEGLLAAVA
jgi:hypothetical protein